MVCYFSAPHIHNTLSCHFPKYLIKPLPRTAREYSDLISWSLMRWESEKSICFLIFWTLVFLTQSSHFRAIFLLLPANEWRRLGHSQRWGDTQELLLFSATFVWIFLIQVVVSFINSSGGIFGRIQRWGIHRLNRKHYFRLSFVPSNFSHPSSNRCFGRCKPR